jgi:CBS domain-containing protein
VIGARFDLTQAAHLEEARSSLLAQVASANIVLALFNLIPAFPMDGGRVLRALLATNLGYARATNVSAKIGQGIAAIFGFLGLFGNPFLILIAVFIFLAASGEASFVEARTIARGHLVSEAMVTNYEALSPGSSLDGAGELLLRTTQKEFPVVDGGGNFRGIVTREAIVAGINERDGATPVLDIMVRDVPTVPDNAYLDRLFTDASIQGQPFVAVIGKSGRFEGYLTPENVAEFVMIRNSRRASQ